MEQILCPCCQVHIDPQEWNHHGNSPEHKEFACWAELDTEGGEFYCDLPSDHRDRPHMAMTVEPEVSEPEEDIYVAMTSYVVVWPTTKWWYGLEEGPKRLKIS